MLRRRPVGRKDLVKPLQRRFVQPSQAIMLRGREHLQLDAAGNELVDRQLAYQAEEVAGQRCFLRRGSVPGREFDEPT